MVAKIDLTGQVFGKLTVVREVGSDRRGAVLWECRCECGMVKSVRGVFLRRGHSKSCGKAPCVGYFKDITGQVFGMLTVKKFVGVHKKNAKWECQCACGNTVVAEGRNLTNGHTSSCGCLKGSSIFKHGHTIDNGTKEYSAWRTAKIYSTRGIITSLHLAWRDSFEQFLADVGPAPSPKHQLRRIDMSRGVEPGNVRWVGPAQEMPF